MLVLSRRVGEKILIGPAVVTILEIRGRQIRLGIDAPTAWTIARQEIVVRLPTKRLPPRQGHGSPPE